MVQVNDAANGSAAPTKYEYNAQDNLTKVIDPKNLATTYGYNGFGELVSQTSPDTGAVSFTRDSAGNMLTKTDARGVTSNYSYDALNRVSTISYPAYLGDPAETVTYSYDICTNGKGRVCSIADKTGNTAFAYDPKGRVVSKSQVVGGVAQAISYGYNSAGQLSSITYPSGAIVTYSYSNNRAVSVKINGKTVLDSADYEPFGPVGEWLWGNGTASVVNRHTRYYDLDGKNTKIESADGLDPSVIVYDNASRITAIQKLSAGIVDPAKSFSYSYDNLDRLTGAMPGAGNTALQQSYTYDAIGNRLSNVAGSATTTYGYGASSHRLNSLTGATSKSYSYDSSGNQTAAGGASWTYGANNRPLRVTIAGVTTEFQINALGQRVRKSTGSAAVRFLYDERGKLIGEYDDTGNRITETVWFNDLPVAVMK